MSPGSGPCLVAEKMVMMTEDMATRNILVVPVSQGEKQQRDALFSLFAAVPQYISLLAIYLIFPIPIFAKLTLHAVSGLFFLSRISSHSFPLT